MRKSDPVMEGFYADPRIKRLEIRIKELEELTKNMGSDKALSEVLYEYHERSDKAEARVRELKEGIEGILNQKDLVSFVIQKQLEELLGKEKP